MNAQPSSSSRRYIRYGFLGVLGAGVALFAVYLLTPHWGSIAPGLRPMFTDWRPGDRGWTWRKNWVWNADHHLLLFDEQLNVAVLVISDAEDYPSIEVDANGASIKLHGQVWQVDRRPNTLFVAVASEELRLFGVPAQYVKRVASHLPHPEGGYEGNLPRILIEEYNGQDVDALKDLLRPANAPAGRSLAPLPSVDNLVTMTDTELAQLDIAKVNLICAAGLPGAENLDIDRYLAALDKWAEAVRMDTDRHLYYFDQNPSNYENSEAYFRLLSMTTVLQLDCGVKYNPAAIRDVDFSDPRDQFIHGIIDGHGGTCASLPVFYVAIGRRLGYPVKLSTSIGHVFARWDDPVTGERINFEAAGNGMVTHPDDYYKTWPQKMSPRQIESGDYLVSLSPRQELAHFLGCRGHCELEHRQGRDAEFTYFKAHDLCPTSEVFKQFLRDYVAIRDKQGFKPPTEGG